MAKSSKLIIFIVIAVIIGLGVYIAYSRKNNQSYDINNQPVTSTETSQTTPKISDSTEMSVDDFLKTYSSLPNTSVDTIKKATYYAGQISAFNENTSSIAFVVDPSDKTNIYFTNDSERNFIRSKSEQIPQPIIYLLNTKTGVIKNLYTANSIDNRFIIIGSQAKNLIFFQDDFYDSPGPCWNPWTFNYHNPKATKQSLVSLNLTDTKAGFKSYTVSQDKINLEISKENQCMKDLDKNSN